MFDFEIMYFHCSTNLEQIHQHLQKVSKRRKHLSAEKEQQTAVLEQKVLHLGIMTWYLVR